MDKDCLGCRGGSIHHTCGRTPDAYAAEADLATVTGEPMNTEDAVAMLDALGGNDPEIAHGEADRVLLAVAPQDVREAYERLVARCRWWACA